MAEKSVHPDLLTLLEDLVQHAPVSPTDKAHMLTRLDDLRDPEQKSAREAQRESERQAAIKAQIEALQAQLGAPAQPVKNTRG